MYVLYNLNRKTNGLINFKTRNDITYEPHQDMTITEQQVPEIEQVQTNATRLKVLIDINFHPT